VVGERGADVELGVGIAAGVIGAQFADLAGAAVASFGAGWDHELFTVGDEWIFRFPKRAERVPWLEREIQINAIAAAAVGRSVPLFERIGAASAAFPYPFVGYRRLPGVAADRAHAGDPSRLAEDIGALLSELHRADFGSVPPTPDTWEHESWAELREELTAEASVVRPLLPPGLRERAEPYLAGAVPEPAQDGPRRFIHNDICPDHLIVDPDTGRLAGLIDFTDAMVGEVVLDFVGLIGVGGYDFINLAGRSYDLPLGARFAEKLEWLARTLTLTWLAEAASHDPAMIGKHQLWVRRAFSG
jgi:aminoglycoside phosphotransferase (APT) family kinase protein